MSEYQYYEFAAVERPLTPQQQAELRSHSSRGKINSTSFVNEYHWGSLNANPLDWMRLYFDAHVYVSSFDSHRLMLRLPLDALNAAELAGFIAPAAGELGFSSIFSAEQSDEHWIFVWESTDQDGEFEYDEAEFQGAGWMGRLLPLRNELLRGDTRPLYLGWLARASQGEFEPGDLEPALPAGLRSLSAAQQALADFLLIDTDWLSAAAAASPAMPAQPLEESDGELWLQEQTPTDMQAAMRLLLTERGPEAERNVRRAYLAWQRSRQTPTAQPTRRSVAQIEEGVEGASRQRLDNERLVREKQAAQQRAQHVSTLNRFVQEAPQIWQQIDTTLAMGSGAAYEKAFNLLQTLAEAMQHANREADFRQDLARLLVRHGRRPAWMKRLEKASWA